MTEEQNIVKKVCAELGITQKELAEELGMKATALSNWANGDIPQIAQKALELLLENKKLKDDLNIIKKAHEILHS
ncbi:helix-turn-helix domain-containing protein [Aliarcobacter cryaerophilus]|uniref:helix-turn-helix domain-containing protein n=1 Tax=Aliarcobacter cryaerophilus TaxID=28198 RepID=UPI0021B69AC7|nr:helix-turn-helix transcriptional regulator [Aliarcobacter cryaerophilus]MCT7509993.1 helix-turn-helix domain-containing protein [Aliarcobacter cryaerophilus]